LCCASATAADIGAVLIDLQQRIFRLEAGVRALKAIRAMKRLQSAYGCDA
jgi:hypothetical protein